MDICFLAIVRDEAPVIERCLTSVKEMINSYLIFDTGSVDNTISIIQKVMEGIPGEVLSRKWISYGETKSELMKEFRNHPIVGKAKYICWLDADEVFITDKNNPLSYPTKEDAVKLYDYLESTPGDIFMLTTVYEILEYQRWQIARNNQLYRWKLPYQEYLVGTESNNIVTVPLSIYNLARHEGNSSRDPEITMKRIAMAEDWLEKNQSDEDYPRMIFYLAEAYQHVNPKKASEIYEKRVLLKGNEEERYESLLRLAMLTDIVDLKLYFWSASQNINPFRLEAYYAQFMYYYGKSDYRKAIGIYQMAPESRIPPPGLFIVKAIYDYLFDLNASYSYFRLGKYKKAYNLGKKILTSKMIDKDRITAENNFRIFGMFYNPTPLNRISPDLPTLLVIDNFYDSPYEIRSKALSMDFGVKGNYPGRRTSPVGATDEMKARFENIIGRKITYWPEQYNGSFQLTTKEHNSWVHRDNTDYSVVIYLTPNAPITGGTVLYQHTLTKADHNMAKDPSLEKMLDEDGNTEDRWDVVDRIGNKFNRAIIFQGKHNHKSDRYFGNGLEDGRLFQTFFFNVS